MTDAPIQFYWDGEAMVPRERFRKLCDREFVVGDTYPMAVAEPRSANSHRHYFAAVAEGWRNLPEEAAEEFPTAEHLRKYAMIRTGFCDRRSIVCASKAEALRVAAFIKPMDQFAVVQVREAEVTVYTAQSQSIRAMGRKVFQQSKDSVLDFIASLVKVTPAALEANARSAA